MFKKLYFLIIASILLIIIPHSVFAVMIQDSGKPMDKQTIMEKAFKMQVPFIVNKGQIQNEDVIFYAKTFGGTVFTTKEGGIVYSLHSKGSDSEDQRMGIKNKNLKAGTKGIALRETIIGGSITEIKGEGESATKVSYFKGNNSSKWKNEISTYTIANFGEIYKGIELKLKAYGNNVEKLFYVKPTADSEAIKVRIEGIKGLRINDKGELAADTEFGEIRFTKPVAYQEINGKRVEVGVNYRVIDQSSESKKNSELIYGFKVGEYDKTKTLVIDPLLASTFLGGSDYDYGSSSVSSIATDPNGNVYVAGFTYSSDFPITIGAFDTALSGGSDVFVSKFNSDLTTLLGSTFLGGSDYDYAYSIATDSSGNVYVTGDTSSSDFPTTTGAFDTTYNNNTTTLYYDVFVTKLNSDLTTLLGSTFLGGLRNDHAYSIAIDSTGNVYVAGYTKSSGFPKTTGAFDTTYNGNGDAFVSKLNSNLTGLLASTFLGGSYSDYPNSIAIDSSGNIYVTGDTSSSSSDPLYKFPTTTGAYDTTFNGGTWDAFISKLNSDLTTLLASTFFGGSLDEDHSYSMVIDSSENVYVTGYTLSSDFPTTIGAFNTVFNGGSDVFVSKLNSDLTILLGSTFLGGIDYDYAYSIAIDSSWNIYVTGNTSSSDFPTTIGAFDTTFNGFTDVFISKLNSDLITLRASTFLGGSNSSSAYSIAIDSSGNIYVTGNTSAADFPTTTGAFDTAFNGSTDVFISKLTPSLSFSEPDIATSPSPYNFGSIDIGSSATTTFTISNNGNADLLIGTIILTGPNASEFNVQNDNCSNQTISPAGNCTVNVAFSPTSAGAKSASLSIPSNDPDTPTLNVLLSGTGGIQRYTLSVTKAGTGSGEVTSLDGGINCGSDCSETYNSDTVVILTATADAGSTFTGWSGACTGTGTCTVTMDSDKNVTATFNYAPGADLIITTVTAPTTAIPGTTITIGDTTKNQGVGIAAPSTTKFYWSTNNSYSTDDLYLGERPVPALAPTTPNSGSISVTVPDTCSISKVTFYIIARADADNGVVETNENNNNKAKSIKEGPDFIVSTITAPATSGAGKTVTVTDTTKNNGGCPTTVDAITRFYLSTNSTWDALDTPIGERTVGPLAAGDSSGPIGTSVTIPAGTPTSTTPYYIIARADANTAVLETIETNNNKSKSIKIGPDLIVSAITAPLTATAGQSISIKDTTKNSGGGDAEASTTKLYLSTNTTYNAGDTYLGERAAPSLAGGATSIVSTSVTIPSGISGAYYIIAVSDAGSVVVETSETNNTKYKAITINY
ncbi:MAG: SBBP repeat-containing protein [Nitrospirae bacterium]|nr:SBBP repeat-containing protein [Nitrospirota bacterium]